MEFRACLAFLLVNILTSICFQFQVFANQDNEGLPYKVDGTEVVTPMIWGNEPEDFCVKPALPSNGEMYCGQLAGTSRRYACIGRCDYGFEFPNREKKGKIICDLSTGKWKPRSTFPNCVKEITCNPPCKNGGTCVAENVCSCPGQFTGNSCQLRLCTPPCRNGGTCLEENTCSCSPQFEGKNCEIDVCLQPEPPINGKIRCDKIRNKDKFACIATCDEAHHFPDGQKSLSHECDFKAKMWTPKYEFPDCEAECDPPCQNGGKCVKENKCVCPSTFGGDRCRKAVCTPSCENEGICRTGNKCTCPPNFEGARCETAKFPEGCVNGWTEYFNIDGPNYSEIGDDESIDSIKKSRPFCIGGIIKDIECKAIVNKRFVDYREIDTTGIECSPDIGLICNRQVRGACEDFAVRFLCECAFCNPPCQNGGSCAAGNKCVCSQSFDGARCENNAVCSPPCQNGGRCAAGNKCVCMPNFEGERCENAVCSPPCRNGGICAADNKCACMRNFQGERCENAVCSPPCRNGGRCAAGNKCVCMPNFQGERCENNALCSPPCRNGGSCATGNKCVCMPNFEGERCENEAGILISTSHQICPEVPSHVSRSCPSSCPKDFACVDSACFPRDECPCFRNGTGFTPAQSMWNTGNCSKRCECKIGGYSICRPISCQCLPGERPVMDSSCVCTCISCSDNTVFCPEKGECLEIEKLCDGSLKCRDIQITCPTESPWTVLPPAINPVNCSTDNQEETDTCEISGNMFQTFDGYAYQYESCDHVIVKERISESFSVTVHTLCSSENPDICYQHLIINVDGLVVTLGPGIDTVTVKNTVVSSDNLFLVSKRFPHMEVKKSGNSLVFKSLKYNFDVTWGSVENARIKVSKCLVDRIVGLCGSYNKNPEDDLNMPNNKMAPSILEFGDSWAIGSVNKCSQPNYTPEITSKAAEVCIKLREKPFNSCFSSTNLNRKFQSCVNFMLECMQRSIKIGTKSLDESEYEKCKCSAYESFAETCDVYKMHSVQEWRTLYGCVPTCSHGMEWRDCGPGCELTCDNYRQRSEICTSTCVPGCYCPPGMVRHKNQCIKPSMCQDCICRGHGDPNYITFDGRYYSFQGTCVYILAQHWASEDVSSNFRILGSNAECPEEPKTSCTQSIKIIWNGHTIEKQKYHPVYLDRKALKTEEFPYDKGGISITYVPHKTTLVHIKKINLVVRYFDQMHGFTIELPSFYYYNKTEGLCGVCNFMQSDDLYHRDGYVTDDIEDFAYSWLFTKKPRKECELERVNIPVVPPPGICNFTASPCDVVLDPSPYVKSCQNDVTHSRRPDTSMCRSKLQYAQQCCERGVPLDDWLWLSGCGASCPAGMVYKCTSACLKTCENYKTFKEEDCPTMPQSTCVCPEGEVLKLGKCVKYSACEVCDAKGHAVGDVWQDDPCKTCECQPDLSIKCTVKECLELPVCNEQEMLLKTKSVDACCDSYKCVNRSDEEGCEVPTLEVCPPGEALVLKRSPVDGCSFYECECFPHLCPPNTTPFLEDGESLRVIKTSCCPEMKIRCNVNSCAPPPQCNEGFKLSTEKGRCCDKHKCVPQENICIYQHQYTMVNGTQMKLPLEKYYDKEYKPGSSWQDGLCRQCTCLETKSRLISRCKVQICQNPDDFPDSGKYIRAQIHVPGSCCPKYKRRSCIDHGINYKINDEWSSPDGNSCRKISRCVLDSNGEAVIEVTSRCERPCTR